MDLRNYIASIPDYPSKGIVFRDISPLMADGDAYREATKQIVDYAKEKRIDNCLFDTTHSHAQNQTVKKPFHPVNLKKKKTKKKKKKKKKKKT
ncbi:hypothetical protein K4E_13580 [Enterococcus thailandicus]|nr:hypothetical protein K4E_13580 [Enterococcus thailandicus]